ncbi:ubiquitin-specific protease [Aspergillus steynii IBT 23096]|uniref:ubiquitinyl hydrolase 1 n=1 Tax=Aspergillus steynii IBT 23096 TaxID=1392250 RepID=A0A2I2FUG9_9EURO|nr:ubiquitin-specific protease [Aspergillus steynii IBT 23096]PLB44251.1 ubiquitin-specific protease [Aspergillus steynii IBT 23096]
MNARRGGIDILTQSPWNTASSSHYDTVMQHLQNSSSLAYILVTVISVYFILNHFRSVLVPLARVLWDILVYLTPSRIVAALDPQATKSDSATEVPSLNFSAKSEAMQRIFGLDNSSSFSSLFPGSTTLSGLGTAILGNKDTLPPGLGNWDNSCYQNSIIQGLASLRSLDEFLERNIQLLAEKGLLSTHQALKDIIERLNSAACYGQRLWTPADLKSMSSWQQQDAQEYFAKVVDQVDLEVHQATKRQTRNLGLKMAGPQEHVIGSESLPEEHDVAPAAGQPHEPPSFRNPLEGLLAQRVGCMKCGWTEGLSLIPFNCLTVPLGASYAYDVQDCLHDYMNLEPIEGVECAKCTLLHAQDQLQNLLQQIEDDEGLSNTPDSPKLSDALRRSAQERLKAVQEALEEEDFSEKILSKKCHIPAKNRVCSTKSRQAVIARPPKCLSIHINRSLFDENTGMLRKNYAAVRFPKMLDLSEWCLGKDSTVAADKHTEQWDTDPRESMLPPADRVTDSFGRQYELRAVVTHYGRHENGHYICYRKYSTETFPVEVPESVLEADGDKEKSERWYRLSDEDVQMVSESNVMNQGGVFMLFYEAVGPHSGSTDFEEPDTTEVEESTSTPEDMSTGSTRSTATEGSFSGTSRATSVSAPEPATEKFPPYSEIE